MQATQSSKVTRRVCQMSQLTELWEELGGEQRAELRHPSSRARQPAACVFHVFRVSLGTRGLACCIYTLHPSAPNSGPVTAVMGLLRLNFVFSSCYKNFPVV